MFGAMNAWTIVLWAIIQIGIFAVPILAIYALWRFVKAYERRGAERSEVSVLKDRLLRERADARIDE